MELLKELTGLTEGFSNKIKGGKVPIGEFTFVYQPKNRADVQFIFNSAKIRKVKKVGSSGAIVVITANAMQHESLIKSFQLLGLNGEVRDEEE